MFILPADEEFSKEVDAWAAKQTSKRMEKAKVIYKSRCIKKDKAMNDVNVVTKTRECTYYGAFIEENSEDGGCAYKGNATCMHPSRNMPNINAETCYCCTKNSMVLGYGYNGQGA